MPLGTLGLGEARPKTHFGPSNRLQTGMVTRLLAIRPLLPETGTAMATAMAMAMAIPVEAGIAMPVETAMAMPVETATEMPVETATATAKQKVKNQAAEG